MDIKIYNSLTNQIEPFKALEEGKVSMYVCGPTVYGYPHIGNMRPVVVFDVLRRFLTYVGYEVTYVSNFTDVDDKIIKKAKEEGKSEKELTEFFIGEFKKTTKAIGSQIPSITPKVTEYINAIISYIDNLVNKRVKEYISENGNSLLCRLYGLYKLTMVKGQDFLLIVMRNVIGDYHKNITTLDTSFLATLTKTPFCGIILRRYFTQKVLLWQYAYFMLKWGG